MAGAKQEGEGANASSSLEGGDMAERGWNREKKGLFLFHAKEIKSGKRNEANGSRTRGKILGGGGGRN